LSDVRSALDRVAGSAGHPLRVRLLVSRGGNVRTETTPLEQLASVARVGLAARPIDPTNPFLFHKTTNRVHLLRERLASLDETILWNPDGEVTEALTANLVIELDGRNVTPPAVCGLLRGTLRAELLERGEVVEARVSVDRLREAPRFWLVNSVRGWRPAVLAQPSGASLV